MKVRSTVLLLFAGHGLSANEALTGLTSSKMPAIPPLRERRIPKALQASSQRRRTADRLRAISGALSAIRARATRTARAPQLWKTAGKTQDAAAAARRAVLLDLIAGDRAAAETDLATYRSAGRERSAASRRRSRLAEATQTVQIPGPLRSFARMAALSPDIQPEDVLPALARNVVTNGFQASHAQRRTGRNRIPEAGSSLSSQARELDKLAGADKVIKIAELRIHPDQRSAAHPRLPDARRLRQRSGARNGERAARLPHHRFRLSAGRTGTGAAHR